MSLTYAVTGASRGLGLEFVNQIAAKGHTVIALARNPSASEGLQKLVDNKKVFSVQLETTDEKSIKSAVEEASKISPQGIDVLINNAGISGSRDGNIRKTDKEDYIHVFTTNVVAVADVTTAFLPLLRQRGIESTKKIVNMSSGLGSIARINTINPTGRGSAYSVSKAALNMLTKMTANQLASENFIVYASHPGWVRTDLGGEDAPYDKKDSIAGMLKIIENLTPEQNGSFIFFEGDELPW
ncbi:4-dihydrotrisporin dehydrogenase [Mucor mucedo]|uniref:4-dihydrotrisporin dehydrogenase n=1 Tax=Mucor mucedo TaxID=29922 RepID=B9DR41_MUCMU|nr:4-dihydrotrisporin dehydrogenase [Mucor mucedo]KAI7895449.1 4-dihydrotrisporin dehydrogenase [Mucor mucedo]CAP72566.1 4-dihydrotrisporin dehydrogenase [Mucor mucedo]